MTSFGKIRRCFATTASKLYFALYVIRCSRRIFYVFGIDVLSKMSSSVICIYSLYYTRPVKMS